MAQTCECPPEAGPNFCELRLTALKTKPACPTNQQIGKPVDSLTIKALLSVPLTELPVAEYHFCRATDCPTVYYSTDGAIQFSEADLRERVYQKHPTDDDVFVCYCFRHTIESIRQELENRGVSTVVASVAAGIQAGQCACDIRNPQGSCCLGNVREVVQRLEIEIGNRLQQGPK
jgi:hypothetical protein